MNPLKPNTAKGNWQDWLSLRWFDNPKMLSKARIVFEQHGPVCTQCSLDLKSAKDVEVQLEPNKGESEFEFEVRQNEHLTAFFQVAPNDENYDSDPSEWSIICPICHHSRFYQYSVANDYATLVFAPWFTQCQVNLIMGMSLTIREVDEHVYRREARDITQALHSLQSRLSTLFPILDELKIQATDDPVEAQNLKLKALCQCLDLQVVEESVMSKLSTLVRIVPLPDRYHGVFNHWEKRIVDNFKPSEWAKLLNG